MCKSSVLESESVSQRIVIYHTRQFMGNWQFFRKLKNIKLVNINNYVDIPIMPLLKSKNLRGKTW